MRNVHLITKEQEGADVLHQYIYITSNEKIKVGDWVIEFQKGDDIGEVHFINSEYVIASDIQKKIILTDNPDLIKYGIQPIDDKFLEWFVKNPSCESIKVVHKFDEDWSEESGAFEISYYKIIIPQEEPKQIKCYCGHTITCDCEPLQETLEEASHTAWLNYEHVEGNLYSTSFKNGFKFGAKWQQNDCVQFINKLEDESFDGWSEEAKSGYLTACMTIKQKYIDTLNGN